MARRRLRVFHHVSSSSPSIFHLFSMLQVQVWLRGCASGRSSVTSPRRTGPWDFWCWPPSLCSSKWDSEAHRSGARCPVLFWSSPPSFQEEVQEVATKDASTRSKARSLVCVAICLSFVEIHSGQCEGSAAMCKAGGADRAVRRCEERGGAELVQRTGSLREAAL